MNRNALCAIVALAVLFCNWSRSQAAERDLRTKETGKDQRAAAYDAAVDLRNELAGDYSQAGPLLAYLGSLDRRDEATLETDPVVRELRSRLDQAFGAESHAPAASTVAFFKYHPVFEVLGGSRQHTVEQASSRVSATYAATLAQLSREIRAVDDAWGRRTTETTVDSGKAGGGEGAIVAEAESPLRAENGLLRRLISPRTARLKTAGSMNSSSGRSSRRGGFAGGAGISAAAFAPVQALTAGGRGIEQAPNRPYSADGMHSLARAGAVAAESKSDPLGKWFLIVGVPVIFAVLFSVAPAGPSFGFSVALASFCWAMWRYLNAGDAMGYAAASVPVAAILWISANPASAIFAFAMFAAIFWSVLGYLDSGAMEFSRRLRAASLPIAFMITAAMLF